MIEVLIEMPRRTSSGSKSEAVVPSWILPRRLVAPLTYRNASANDVFPAPPWEKRPTFLIRSAGYCFMLILLG